MAGPIACNSRFHQHPSASVIANLPAHKTLLPSSEPSICLSFNFSTATVSIEISELLECKIPLVDIMARVVSLVLCSLVLVSLMATPVATARKLSRREVISFAIRAWCIPRTESLLQEHEVRHECVYSLKNGDRAVGVGYDLDDEKETRRSELSTVLADYDKVYKGLQCLNTVQISALLAFDTRRTLDRAAKSVKALDEQCCSVMAVFGDIQHSAGKDAFEGDDFQDFIEAVSAKKWLKAGEKLDETRWCNDNKERCQSDKVIIYQGCGGMKSPIITQVTNLKA